MNKKGTTIVEVVATLFIMGVLAVALSALFIWGFRLWKSSDEQSRALQSMRAGYEKTVKEIREMRTASNGAYPIERATTSELIFYGNIDQDDERERVRLTLSGTNIIKGIIQPAGNPPVYTGAETTETIMKYVRNANIFSYYDQSFSGTGSALPFPVNVNNVRLIKFSPSIDVDPLNPPGAFFWETNITPRNLKQNL